MKLKIMMLVSATSLAVFLAPQVIAGPGKSGDNSSSGHSSASNSNADDGMLTAKMNDLNAAHANANAFENAAAESMPGKLAIYMAAFSDVEDAEADLVDAEAEVIRLSLLDETDDEFKDEVDPLAAYVAAVTAADTAVTDAEEDLADAEDDLEDAIFALTGETELDADVEAELHALLGI